MDGDKELIDKLQHVWHSARPFPQEPWDRIIALVREHDAAETRVEELEHRIEGLIDKYEGCPHTVDCGCAQDKPSDICAHHAPQLRKALAENERLDKQIARFLEPKGRPINPPQEPK